MGEVKGKVGLDAVVGVVGAQFVQHIPAPSCYVQFVLFQNPGKLVWLSVMGMMMSQRLTSHMASCDVFAKVEAKRNLESLL